MRSVALANQKGGVGKTTCAIHLAHGMALRGDKVALFDLDPQGNATVALQAMTHQGTTRDGDDLLREVEDGLWLLASPGASAVVDEDVKVDLAGLQKLVSRLEAAGFHWLFVDCPPRMDVWGWAGIRLCQQVLVPVQAEFFAMHGLSQMLATLEEGRKRYRGSCELLGVLATIVDRREQVDCEVVDDLRRNLGPLVFESSILRDSMVVEAASHGETVFRYSPGCKAAFCFAELVREVVHGGSQAGTRS